MFIDIHINQTILVVKNIVNNIFNVVHVVTIKRLFSLFYFWYNEDGDIMKVLTVREPWASLIINGYKKYEFRSWKTNHRGKLLIHAGIGIDKEVMEKVKHLGLKFPSRKIIACVDLTDCLLLDEELNNKIINEKNIAYGNKVRTGYAWKLDNIKKINYDKEVNGQLGLWNIDLNEKEITK